MTNIKLIIFLIIANIIFAQSSTARVEGSHTLTQGDGVGIYQAVDLCLKQAIINGVFNYLDTTKFHGIIPGPVADNKKNYFASLEKLIKQKNLSNHLTFCGARSDIAEIYKVSDVVFNLSSKPEPFGRTIIEAAACGTHVMGWDRGGVKESIELINPEGLIEYGNIEMLANQINQILDQTPPQSIPEQFLKEHLVNSTLDVYKLALSKLA